MKTKLQKLPLPSFYEPKKVGEWKWKVNYQARFDEANAWAKTHGIEPAYTDRTRIALMPIDTQLTFCHPEFELFVGGRSGSGAIEDNRRLAEFIYANLGVITKIHPTMDTHLAAQIFHQPFWVDAKGNPPGPHTILTYDQVKNGTWRVNPGVTYSVTGDARRYTALQAHALHYVKTLTDGGKYPLIIWPFHAMLGGISHALVPAVEEALFFHNIARASQTDFQIKGGNPLTENYSVLAPEVLTNGEGRPIGQKNTRFIEALIKYDAVIIAGQAKSHCVAWTVRHLLDEMVVLNKELAKKVYLLEDCMSPVVVPGVKELDFTDQADATFADFQKAGMNLVRSTTPIEKWPGMDAILA
jgi:nicotinamidase-related amidase